MLVGSVQASAIKQSRFTVWIKANLHPRGQGDGANRRYHLTITTSEFTLGT
jgi:hypothetical protein